VPDSAQSPTDSSLPAMEEDCVTEKHLTFENVHNCLELIVNSEDDLTQLEHRVHVLPMHTINLVASSDID